MELFEILDPSDPRAARLPLWERAMEHYFAKRPQAQSRPGTVDLVLPDFTYLRERADACFHAEGARP